LVREYRTPDIYFEKATNLERVPQLEKARVDIPAFLGFAQRGPVGTPVRITSWESFQAIFGGFSADAYLPQSVFGFFANGGSVCYVCRIAVREGKESSQPAKGVLEDLYGRPTLRVTAKDPGTWGNKIRVRCVPASRPPRTPVRADLKVGATEAQVDVMKGFEPGAVLKISDGERNEYAVLERIEKRKLVWTAEHELRASYDASKTTIEAVELQLQISTRDQLEIHDNLSFQATHPRSLVAKVNEDSRLVKIEDLRSTTPKPFNFPVTEVEFSLSGGQDGTTHVAPRDFIGWDRGPGDRGGLLAFEEVDDVGVITVPDLFTGLELALKSTGPKKDAKQAQRELAQIEAVQQEVITFCERKKTCFALLDPPPRLDPDQVRDWRSRFDSKYAACYYPWINILDPLAKGTRTIPPCGHVAGLYARVDRDQGVHKAPANEVLNDVVGLARVITKDVTDVLGPEGINCIRALPGRGIRPWGARTLSSDKLWQHVNVRRLFIMIERSIAEGTEWAVFENNEWSLWKAVEREVSRFLFGLWKEGMLRGNVPEEAFYVVCDERNNVQESRDAGEFFCDIGVAAVRPAEFIIFRIGQRTQDIITEEPVS
jgi:hypothetical protein